MPYLEFLRWHNLSMSRKSYKSGVDVVAFKKAELGQHPENGKRYVKLHTYGKGESYVVYREDIDPMREILQTVRHGDTLELSWIQYETSKYKVVKGCRVVKPAAAEVMFDVCGL